MFSLHYEDGNMSGYLQLHKMINGDEVLCLESTYMQTNWLIFKSFDDAERYLDMKWKNNNTKQFVSIVPALPSHIESHIENNNEVVCYGFNS